MVSRAGRRGLSPSPGVSPKSAPLSPAAPPSSPQPPSNFLRLRCRQLAGRSVLPAGFKSKLPRGGVWGRAAEGEGMVCRGGELGCSNSFSPVQQRPGPCAQRRRGGQLGSCRGSGPCPTPAKPWVRGPDRGPKLARAAWAPRPRVSARSQVASFLAVVVAFHRVLTHVWVGVCMCVRTGVRGGLVPAGSRELLHRVLCAQPVRQGPGPSPSPSPAPDGRAGSLAPPLPLPLAVERRGGRIAAFLSLCVEGPRRCEL